MIKTSEDEALSSVGEKIDLRMRKTVKIMEALTV